MSLISKYSSLNGRTLLMVKNVVATALLKVCSGLISLALVPLTLYCLGEYENGVWLTIASTLLWIDNLDIGLGNGLRNKLSAFIARDDMESARKAVSTTLLMLVFIILPAMILLVVLTQTLDIYAILGVDHTRVQNLPMLVSVGIILFCSTFIMKFIGNVYLGLQLPALSNFLVLGGQPLVLLGTWLMYHLGIHSLLYITTLNLGVPLLMYCCAYPYTFYWRYPHLRPSLGQFDRTMVRGLLSLGILFFVNQIASSIVFLSSNLVISHWFTPSAVTPYQIAFRYFNLVFVVFTIINTPIWSATTDAYERGEFQWIRQSMKRVDLILLLLLGVLVLMVAVSDWVYSIWIGNGVCISLGLSVAMALYIMMLITSLAYCFFLNGMGKLRLQLICTVSGTFIFIASALLMREFISEVWLVAVAITLALMPNVICNYIQAHKIINHSAHGIWNK